MLTQLDTFIGRVNDQTDDIIKATDSLNRLVDKFAAQRPIIDKGLDTIPAALPSSTASATTSSTLSTNSASSTRWPQTR